MKIKFLLDENLSPRLKDALYRIEPKIDVVRVGDEHAPAFSTPDETILEYLSLSQRMLITDNRSTMPGHLDSFYGEPGRNHWGILWVRPNATMAELAGALHLIWSASEAEEWVNRADWVPF